MNDVRNIPLTQLRVRTDARQVDFETVDALASSIGSIGHLLNPIVVRERDEGLFEIVAGAHRFMACDKLEWEEAPCRVETLDDVRAELAMIDENLCRAELSPADRAHQTARRKTIYEALHPETKAHVAGAIGSNRSQGNAVDNVSAASFAEATAVATGQSDRSVRRHAHRGEAIEASALEAVKGTRLDRGKYLDELARVPREEQTAKVQEDLVQPRPPVERAAPRPQEPSDEAFTRFVKLADEIEGLGVRDIIAAAGKQRSLLGQRASGLGSMMDDIGEGLASA